MRIKVNSRQFDILVDKIDDMSLSVMKQGHVYLRNKTPIDQGNARNRTKRQGLTIRSKYPYAGRLDEGWSKQAPNGFTEPTIDELERLIDNYIKRVT
jgi:hypothetical protein